MPDLSPILETVKTERDRLQKEIDEALAEVTKRKKALIDFDASIRAQLAGLKVVPPHKAAGRSDVAEARRAKLLELVNSGITARAELQAHCNVSSFTVYKDISILRQRGVWPERELTGVELPRPPRNATRAIPKAAPVEVDDGDDDDDCEAASLDELHREIARQQDGNVMKQAKLKSTKARNHKHDVLVGSNGLGMTVSDKTGHCHRVVDFVIQVQQNHRHDLCV